MLSDFTWNMTGYIPKHHVNPHGDSIIPYVAERIFQLEPEPPKVGSLNEYILSALQEKNLIHFSFFLHPVSYTHLDVYKRQVEYPALIYPKPDARTSGASGS